MQNFEFETRKIQYRFYKAKVKNAPLVVILHGHTKTPAASRYQSPDVNVLSPVDNFGYEGWGSWFLGERGDHFWIKAMPALIKHVYQGTEIYFCGSSMGGYGAILHGTLNRAVGVYANIPQTQLLGSSYSNDGMKRYFAPIFQENMDSKYNDLKNILHENLPTSFIISGLRWDKPKYIEEQTFPFLNELCRLNINFRSEIHFGEGHKLTYTTAESVDLLRQNFERMRANYTKKKGMTFKNHFNASSTPINTVLPQVLAKYLPKESDQIRENARNIIARETISVHSYKLIPVADRFWHSGDQSARSWRFSLYSFAPLDALMACGEWDETVKLVSEWAAEFGAPKTEDLGDFPWHDHATALRLDRLSILRMAGGTLEFSQLAKQHAEVLMQDVFYSKHTNHGYDQALALLLASHAFKDETDTRAWAEVGLSRLIDELQFAFTSEGVHVENSPAYHVGMTTNLVRARLVKTLVGATSDFDFDTLLNDALMFTSWITGPDHCLALLGDSTERGGVPPIELANLPNYAHAIYAASGGKSGTAPTGTTKLFEQAGYAVYRSSWKPWSHHVHLVMKSSHLSRYHRQDDDLNVLLQAHGEHWLIDSGLYNHNQKDPARIYMRSALAHNVPFIRGCPISRALPEKNKAPTLAVETFENGHVTFRGTTHAYRSAILTRSVTIESPDRFQIIDTVRSNLKDPEIFFQFHVPADKTVRVSPHLARITGEKKELLIRVAAGKVEGAKLFSGLDGEFKSVHSPNHNILNPSQVIVFGPLKGNRIRFSLDFRDI